MVFLEVQPNKIKVLADTALRAENMDQAAAEKAKIQALQKLENRSGEFDYSRAATQLAEATAQLRTLQAVRKKLGK